MAGIDYSHILGQAPQTGAARGQKFFGDALDAVLQRRQEMEARKMQLEAQAQQNALQRDLTQGYYDQQETAGNEQRAEANRQHLATEAQAVVSGQNARDAGESNAYSRGGEAAMRGSTDLARRIVAPYQQSGAPPSGPMSSPLDARPPVPTGGQPGPGQVPAPTPAPPPQAGPIADPAAASSQMQRPAPGMDDGTLAPGAGQGSATGPPEGEVDWGAMTPQALVQKLMEDQSLHPRIKEVLPEMLASGADRPAILAYVGKVRDRMSHEQNARLSNRFDKPATRAEQIREGALADSLLNSITRRTDYVQTIQKLHDTRTMLSDFQSGNPAQEKAAAGVWAKAKSGPGAVQQTERDEFVNSIGGIDEMVKKKIMFWLEDGNIPPEQLGFFVRAIRDFEEPRQQRRMADIEDIARQAYGEHPLPGMRNYQDWAVNQLRRRASTAPSKAEAAPATRQDIDDLLDEPDEIEP